MKKEKLLILVSLLGLTTGCLTRAPTSHELDKRAGLRPPNESAVKEVLSDIDTNSSLKKSSYMPARVGPVIQKVWVTDQHLPDGSLLQGTWLFLEVEPGKWYDEIDQDHAEFIDKINK